jgi:hypothetical protein
MLRSFWVRMSGTLVTAEMTEIKHVSNVKGAHHPTKISIS